MTSHRVTFHDEENLFLDPGRGMPTGLVYRTRLYQVRLEHMGANEYGMVNVAKRPFKITLNASMTYPRIEMSLVHELLHVYCELYKVDLSHEQLHMLALLVDNEILPSVSALADFTRKAH